MNRLLFFCASLLLLSAGCDAERLQLGPFDDQQNSNVSDHRLPDDLDSDAFELNRARMDGSVLHLNVSYSGGCEEHIFNAYNTGQVMKSLPPGLVLYIAHDGGGDLCEAYLTEDVQIDLSWLITEMGGPFWMNVAVLGSDSATIRVEYNG